jgi:long-chain fatty acid transport protein
MNKHPVTVPGLAGLAFAALTVAVSGVLVAPPASASGFQLNENSVKAMGRAYAGRATAGGDASVVFNNPAAMADLDGYMLQVDATAISTHFKYSGTGTDAIGQALSGGNGGNGGGVAAVPAIFFVAPMGDAWRVGFGVTAPFGLKTEYDGNWMGRYNAIKSSLKIIDYTGSLSWAVNPGFSLGLSVIAQKATADLSNAVNYGAIFAGPPFNLAPTFLPQSADGLARVRGDDWAWGWQLGAEFKPTAQDRIAIDYRAEINHTLSGNAYFSMPQSVQFVLSQPGVPPLFQNTGARADLDTPATISASYWHQTQGPIGWGVEVSRTGWSSFDQLRVDYDNPAQPPTIEPEDWRDTWFASLGMDYKVSDQWTWRAGVAYDQNPTRDSTRSPRLPDGSRRWIALGATWSPNSTTELNFGYVHLFVGDGDINNVSATGDHLVGSFDNSADLFGISMQYKF